MGTLWQDLRYAIRMLTKNPGFTAVAILTLALGIGANTAIFTYINAVRYRIVTFPDPEGVAFVWSASRASGGAQNPVSLPDFLDWREQAQSFQGLAAVTSATRTLSGGGEPERVSSVRVTANFFQLLGITPSAGRAFLPEEDQPGASPVVLLSHQFWQRRFGGHSNVLPSTISLDGQSYTVVGLLPADFRFVEEGDIWEPLALDARRADRNLHFLTVFGRLKPGVTVAQADAEMENITERIAKQFPETNAGWGSHVMATRDVLWGPQGRMASTLLMAVVFTVLLIACANIASLLLARAASRQKEIAVRLALGASRFRLVRQLLTENLVLAWFGGALGLLMAVWGMDVVKARYGGSQPLLNDAVVDGRVLSYTVLLTVLSAVMFGLAPALRASRPDLHESLKEGGRTGVGGKRTGRARSALVVAEISLALVLLVVAGLMIRTIIAFQLIPPGFDPNNLLTMRVSLPEREYSTDPQTRQFFERVLSQLASQPGVRSAGAITRLPLAGSSRNPRRSITIEGKPATDANDQPWTVDLTVSPGYFDAIGIPLLTGRPLSAQDTTDSPRVAVISQTMARKYWPNHSPLGERFRFESSTAGDPWIAIVGVVSDVRNDDVDQPPLPQVYVPHAQNPAREMSLVVRTAGDPLRFARSARQTVWAIDRHLPVYELATMNQLFFDDLAGVSIIVELLGAFAALALVLATVGINGVMSYSVAQRTHEVGIRMALGAQARDVLKLIVGQGVKLALMGIVIGLAASLAVAQLLKSLLFGVSASDPLTLVGVALLLAIVALLACYIPARRAAKVDPMVALRYE